MEAQIEKIQEMFNKEIEEIKNRWSAMNSTVIGITNILEGTGNKITEAEKRISEMEDRMVEMTEA